jgi:hypothetical protein
MERVDCHAGSRVREHRRALQRLVRLRASVGARRSVVAESPSSDNAWTCSSVVLQGCTVVMRER